jgi:hypothetical protein
MKKNASRLRLEAFFFIYYDQVLNNLIRPNLCRHKMHTWLSLQVIYMRMAGES